MTISDQRFDVAIIGAGMAGASLAAEIGSRARVALIEGEAQPGYHATGRSAAFWSETYGGPAVQPLTSASGAFLARPPADVAERGFLHPRGALHIARAGGEARLDALLEDFEGSGVALDWVGRNRLAALVPGLREEWIAGVVEPSCTDIDVGGLHAAYLRAAKRSGVTLLAGAPVERIERSDDYWRVATASGVIAATVIVNAAGAWASAVAALAGAQPIAIAPYRRTVVQLRVEPAAPSELPLVIDAAESFYFKPEAGGRVWLSPHDESPSAAIDVAPDELDVAVAIDRLEGAVDWRIAARERAWAGLRSFAPDRAPVYGFDARALGFFWFAGQGGFGIQTAPAAAMLGAALVLGAALPDAVSGIDVERYVPDRFI